jgi:hypothetical protein
VKIDTEDGDSDALVAAHYVRDGVRYYLFVPMVGAQGVNVVSEEECQVVEPENGLFKEMTNSVGDTIFVDPAALEGGLLDKLIEHEDGAVEELMRRIESR